MKKKIPFIESWMQDTFNVLSNIFEEENDEVRSLLPYREVSRSKRDLIAFQMQKNVKHLYQKLCIV